MNCGNTTLHGHGYYLRYLVELGILLRVLVARFLCPSCWRTTSCLPTFALPYRLMATDSFESFRAGRLDAPGIDRHLDLLKSYDRCWEARAPLLQATVGQFFGPIDDEPVSMRLWGGMLTMWKSLQGALIGLQEGFGVTPLGHYWIHDWARAPRGAVDPLRAPAVNDSG